MLNSYVVDIRKTLHAIMEEDERVVVLGEDILDAGGGGAFKATVGLSTKFPGRVITTPVCEYSIVGVSVGLALRRMRPIAEIMFGDFMSIGFDQVINHACKYSGMYNRQVTVPLVIRTPMGGGRGYGPTHSQSIEKHFLGIPDLDVVAPSHAHSVGKLLRRSVERENPVLFVENKLLYPAALFDGSETIRVARSAGTLGYESVRLMNYRPGERPDVCILTYGGVSRLMIPVLEKLAAEEIRVLCCLPGLLSPAPMADIQDAVEEARRVLIVEEGTSCFGWSAEIASRLYASAAARLAAPIATLSAEPTVIPAASELEDKVLPSAAKIENEVMKLLSHD